MQCGDRDWMRNQRSALQKSAVGNVFEKDPALNFISDFTAAGDKSSYYNRDNSFI